MKRSLEVTVKMVLEADDDRWLSKDAAGALATLAARDDVRLGTYESGQVMLDQALNDRGGRIVVKMYFKDRSEV